MENTENLTPAPKETSEESNLVSIQDFMKFDLRVAEILAAEKLEKSNKLVKLRVTLGEELGERQILAGIAKFYTPEELVGKKIVVIANLEPAKLAGEESQGMLMAADSADGQIILLNPDSATVGARIR